MPGQWQGGPVAGCASGTLPCGGKGWGCRVWDVHGSGGSTCNRVPAGNVGREALAVTVQ